MLKTVFKGLMDTNDQDRKVIWGILKVGGKKPGPVQGPHLLISHSTECLWKQEVG